MNCATAAEGLRARAYLRSERLLTGTLVTLSALSLPATFLVLMVWNEPPVAHARTLFEARLLLLLGLVPLVLACAVRWSCAARILVTDGTLVIKRRATRIEVPCSSISCIVPWAVPFPAAGFSVRLRSGRRLRYGVEPGHMAEVIAHLRSSMPAPDSPALAHAIARERVVWRWYHLVAKFVLFPMIPGLIVFRLHQIITFGGPLGEYYLHGLWPYLRTLSLVLAGTCMDCLLWASLWRTLAEGLSFAGAWLKPQKALAVRNAGEMLCSVLYYGGVIFILAYALLR